VLIQSTSSGLHAEAGRAGTITIQGITGPGSPAKTVSLDDSAIATRSGGTIATTSGDIIIAADSAALSNKAVMKATSLGAAPAGSIMLHADTLCANVTPEETRIRGPQRRVFIQSASTGLEPTAGPAGDVTISGLGMATTDAAARIALHNTTVSTAVSGGTAATAPSAITMTADTVALSGTETPAAPGTNIAATSAGPAPAGNIALHVNTLRVNENPDGTRIRGVDGGRPVWLQSPSTSLERTAGPAGNITISGLNPETTDPAALVALNVTRFNTRASGGTEATPQSEVKITADTLTPVSGSEVAARSDGAVPAGNIALHVDTLRANVAADGTPLNRNPDQSPIEVVTFSSSSNSSNRTAGPAGSVKISSVRVSTSAKGLGNTPPGSLGIPSRPATTKLLRCASA
jgi:hypothetical protein